MGAAAQDQAIGELVDHLVEVIDRKGVPLPPPPLGQHAVGEHDQIAGMALAVDG